MGKFSLILTGAALGLAFTAAGAQAANVGPNTTLASDGLVVANVSISVADLDKSSKFYEALGFEAGATTPLPPAVAKVLGAKGDDAKLEIRFVKRDGLVLELIHFTPSPTKKASKGSAKELGLCHIGLRVDSVDRVAKIVNENGGKTLDKGRTKMGPIDILFATDPDGTNIELAGPVKE